MRRENLIDALRASPFRLHASDGNSYEIGHPEMLIVTRHSAIVGIGNGGESDDAETTYPAIDRSTVVDLLHVTQLEQSQRR